MEVMQTVQGPLTAKTQSGNQAWLDQLGERIAADQDARFAISLDRLTYAKDSYQLGFDLVRIFVRSKQYALGPLSDEAAQLLRGLTVLTGRTPILGHRYGDLAVEARDAGGSLFDFQDDGLAREAVVSVGVGRGISTQNHEARFTCG